MERCPYCHAEIEIDHDDGYGFDEDTEHLQTCHECDMPEIRKFARALLQSAAVKDSLTTQADCRTCANRGQVNGLSQESYCDSCIYQGRDWRKNHFVDASKTADAVKRRCDACAVLPCSCE